MKKPTRNALQASREAAIQTCTPGQRWLSETQGELGLGIVLEVNERLARLLFPATGEERAYARDNAPLWRAVFGVGDRVRDLQGVDLEVTALDQQDGLIVYRVRDINGAEFELRESLLDPHLHLNRPPQKLLAGRLDKDIWFRLRYRTWEQQAEWSVSDVRGLVGARISPIPHQLYIASEVAGRWAPRVLLADEVGLGKTIEAGLILHRLLLEGRARRVLVLVPEPLLHQWLVELLRRFNLSFTLLDSERLAAVNAAAGGDGSNPFESAQRVLCSLVSLTEAPANAAAALAAEWDLLIVDEAHHLHWAPEDSGLDYDLVDSLAQQAPAVLLLTATPEQFGRAGHFGRLRLLDPQRFGDYEAFLAEESGYAPVAEIAARLLEGKPLAAEQQGQLGALLGNTSGMNPSDVIARLIDRHGTGRILFRNTRAAISGFPERRVHAYSLPAPQDYVLADPADPLHPERDHEDDWTERDPRVPWLVDILRRLKPAKLLLIAAHADTLLDLRQHLQTRAGVRVSVFHEGMEIVERDRAAAFFADPEEGSQILLCSEIGSEGRNFQFAHHLVLFDLPLDPELLEQRIGRLDRIGQTRAVEIHVPYLAGTAGEVLYRWYAQGLNALAAYCPSAAVVYERLSGQLHKTFAAPDSIDALIAEATALRDELNEALAAGRDRLLELGSHRPEIATRLEDALLSQDRDPALFEYLGAFWDAFGVDHEPGPGGSTVLHPGRHMLQEQFPGLPEDGLTVSFDRTHALAHEDRAFLTWEHPMTRAAMDLLSNSDLGTAAVLLTRDPRFKAGALLLEMLHVAECPAPPELAVGRFLPRLGLRLLLDESGRNHAKDIPSETLTGKCLTGNRKLAGALLEAKADPIADLLAAGETLLVKARNRLQRQAIKRMEDTLDAEMERLTRLAEINQAIRADEIQQLVLQRESLREALTRIHLRLDALRLVVHA